MNTQEQTMTMQQLIEANARLMAEVERLAAHAPKPKGPSLKVSAKGAISLYGLGRFPVTLYASQWEKIFEGREAITNFIQTNMEKLASKDAE